MSTDDVDRPQVSPITRDTLQEQIYRRLTDLILDGAIAPGEQVTVHRLADMFATSAMPVREALRRLTAANVLTVVSGRSIGIPRLSAERLDDLHRVRRVVEPLAAAWAVGNAGQAVAADLSARLEDMRRAIAGNDVDGFLSANRAFHFAIYRAAGSPTLEAMIESLWLQVSPYFRLLDRAGSLPVNNIEHESILAAFLAGDPDAAHESLRRDIDIGCRAIRDLLP